MTITGHVGAGVLAAYLLERYVLGVEVTPVTLTAAAALSVVPDLDSPIVLTLTRNWRLKKKLDHHRFITHTPLFYLIIGTLMSIIVPWQWALLFVAQTLIHLILDSWATDDGIMWAWPLSRRQLSLFSHDLHANGTYHGLEFYLHRYFRCWITALPETLLISSGLLVSFSVWHGIIHF